MAAAVKIAKYQPEVYELKLSLDMNGKILGRLFHFAACFQLRLFPHTCELRGSIEGWKEARIQIIIWISEIIFPFVWLPLLMLERENS